MIPYKTKKGQRPKMMKERGKESNCEVKLVDIDLFDKRRNSLEKSRQERNPPFVN